MHVGSVTLAKRFGIQITVCRVLESVSNCATSRHIVFGVDKNFLPHACVTLLSVLKADSTGFYHFHFISTESLDTQFNGHISFFRQLRCAITLYRVGTLALCDLPVSNPFPAASYLRLLAPKVLPAIDRALYLDADTVCLQPLKGLWGSDSGLLAAVEDEPEASRARIGALGLPVNSRYFNSGVLLMNLDQWREEGITEQVLMCIAERRDSLLYPDQDALNIVLNGKVKYLPQRWNHQLKLGETSTQVPAETVILHYVGEHKPWHRWNDQAASVHYRSVREQLPWGAQAYQNPATARQMKAMARYCMGRGQFAAGMGWMVKRKFVQLRNRAGALC